MKKKVFTLLTLALMSIGTAWAADSDNVSIKTVDFSTDAWATYRTAKKMTKSDTAVDGCKATSGDLIFTDAGEMDFAGSNLGDGNGNNALSIPIENINGSIKVVVTSTNSSSRVYWSIKEGEEGSITNRAATTAGTTQTINYTMTTTATTATLYIGRQGSKVAPQVTKIEVYTADASSVATPTISFADNEVSITCTTTGATIYYTLDGTDPTNASSAYSAAFTIAEDKVVKAIAYKGENHSEVVTKYCGVDKTFSKTTLIRFDDGNFTSPGSLTIEGVTFGSGVSYTGTNASVDGKTFTAGIQFDGGSYNANRFMSFKVSGACKVYIYGHSNATSVRAINVKAGEYPSSKTDGTAVGVNAGGYTDMSLFEYTTESATTIYLTPRDGNNYRVCAIKIVFGNENEYTLKIGDIGYATLALPYATTIPSGVTAYTGTKSTSSITLTEIEDGVIPANTGVVLTATAGSYTFTETTTAGSATSELGSSAGNGIDISGSSDTYYVLTNQEGTAKFAKVTNDKYKVIPSNKAFVQLAAGAPVLDINFGGTTGIRNVERGQLSVEGFYNLNGQRVAQPTNGLYIVNGKKYVVK